MTHRVLKQSTCTAEHMLLLGPNYLAIDEGNFGTNGPDPRFRNKNDRRLWSDCQIGHPIPMKFSAKIWGWPFKDVRFRPMDPNECDNVWNRNWIWIQAHRLEFRIYDVTWEKHDLVKDPKIIMNFHGGLNNRSQSLSCQINYFYDV